MNERFLYDDEFENLLSEKVDQFKMYSSDKVWNEVYSSLHTRRRKFVVGMSFLIGGILILAGKQLLFPTNNIHSNNIAEINVPAKPVELETNIVVQLPAAANATAPFIPYAVSPVAIHSEQQKASNGAVESAAIKIQTGSEAGESIHPIDLGLTEKAMKEKATAEKAVAEKNSGSLVLSEHNLILETSFPKLRLPEAVSNLPVATAAQQSGHLTNRFSWEIYVTPTLNTHYLSGMHAQTIASSSQTSPIMVVHFSNVNGFIDNTPAMGYDVGGNFLYRLSKNISLKAGIEFNYSRYFIKAYNSNSSQASATLSSYLGYVADSLVNYSNNNFTARKNPQQIQNKYYQLSLPVGIEMKLAGNGRIQLHLGATVQPSYLLNRNVYVLSEDYSSYSKESLSLRRWNLNAGGELFLSYRIGKIRWELGPQIRYQIFSTYKNSYPLSENMLNYGIRIGFSKTIW